jgi:NAD-dependent DNA ligase
MDHIRDFYYSKDKDTSNLHEAELNLMLLARRCLELGDNSVYLTKKGEVIPEILHAILAIKQYRKDSVSNKEGKQWFDL